ncbi:helix-turn-helix transcriptional regulator, partial [Pseudoalteromonas sp. GABNS16H]|uniref:helix-turn-helix transcriptional regulator n=1 Tax=Pseudoalteromonas sp. GABNS16H TaxID=3025325 RepID=UPI00235F6156
PMNQKVNDFILSVHDASMHLTPSDFHSWALKEVRRHIDFDFAIWGAGDGKSRELHTATILDQADNLFETWETVKHEDPYAHLVIGNTGKTWSVEQLPDFRHTRAYSDHWGLYQARQMISTMEVDPHTGLHIFVTLARDNQNKAFNKQEISFKNLVTQHFFLAARHNDMHHLRSDQTPAAFIDRHGLLHASLPEFKALLVNEWGKQAGVVLPEAVNTSLWKTGHYRGHNLALNAERFYNRLLVRAGILSSVSLSPRETEIAWAYATGKSHKEVAKVLSISPTTVRTHLARVYQKLEISDKGALAVWLKEHGNRPISI